MTNLTPEPRRVLTDRECASILGGVVGGLVLNAPADRVLTALQWWVEHFSEWPLSPHGGNAGGLAVFSDAPPPSDGVL